MKVARTISARNRDYWWDRDSARNGLVCLRCDRFFETATGFNSKSHPCWRPLNIHAIASAIKVNDDRRQLSLEMVASPAEL